MDREKIEAGVRLILEGVGEDLTREGLLETPRRVAAMYEEIFAGLSQDAGSHLCVTFGEGHQEMVLVRDIPLYSVCEHHLLPFVGKAHVGYLPSDRILGLSKFARVVEMFSRRPQVQERLTKQVTDWLDRELSPRGVGVVLEAEHSCMSLRGSKVAGAMTRTAALTGAMRSDPATRAEFFAAIAGRRAA